MKPLHCTLFFAMLLLVTPPANAQSQAVKDALVGLASKDRKIRRQSVERLGSCLQTQLTDKERANIKAALLLAMKDSDEDVRAKSYESFIHVDRTQAQSHLKDLFAGLSDRSSTVSRASQKAIRAIGASENQLAFLKSALSHSKWTVRREAAVLTGQLGAKSRPILTQLILGTRDSDNDVKSACQRALTKVGVDASCLPELQRLISHRSWSIRRMSIQFIQRLGPKGEPAYGALLRQLNDKDNDVKAALKSALASITASPKTLAPLFATFNTFSAPSQTQLLIELRELLSRGQLAKIDLRTTKDVCFVGLLSRSWVTRREAANTLKAMGPSARWAFMTLFLQSKTDSDSDVKAACNSALSAIGVDATLIPQLTLTLQSNSWVLRRDAARYLGSLGPKARSAYPALVAIRGDADSDVRAAVEKALKQIGKDKKTVTKLVGSFEKLTAKGKEQILKDMASVAKSSKAMSEDYKRVFRLALEDRSWTVRRAAARCLAEFGSRGRWAYILLLKKSFRDSDGDVRSACSKAMNTIGYDSQHTSSFVKLLADRKWSVRRLAIQRLASLKATSAYWQILQRCADSDQDVRVAAEKALNEVGTPVKPWLACLPEFKKMGKESQTRYLKDFAQLFQKSKIEKPLPKAIRTLLLEGLSNRSWTVRRQACRSLAVTGRNGRWAFIRLLRKSLTDSDTDVKNAAEMAYRQIGAEKSHVPALKKLVSSKSWIERRLAIRILGSLGEASKGALLEIIVALKDSDGDVRREALRALPKIDPKGIGPMAKLALTALQGEENDRLKAIAGLKKSAEKCKIFIPMFLMTLDGKWNKVRLAMAELLDGLDIGSEDYHWALKHAHELGQFWLAHKLGRSTIIRAETKQLLKKFASEGKSPRVRDAAKKYLR